MAVYKRSVVYKKIYINLFRQTLCEIDSSGKKKKTSKKIKIKTRNCCWTEEKKRKKKKKNAGIEWLETKRDRNRILSVMKRTSPHQNGHYIPKQSPVPGISFLYLLFSINICTFSLSSYFIKRNDVILGPVQKAVD